MSFTPDVPSGALAPNEYNTGYNVETDTRGIKKINGDQAILSVVPGDLIFVTAGYRANGQWWFIVGNTSGDWYGVTTSGITTLTPTATTYIKNQYSVHTNITAAWNGTTVIINDTVNPPMYLRPTGTEIRLYDYSYSDQTPNTYTWNYYASQGYTNVTAGFVRLYNSPNLGAILVAGNITYTLGGVVYNNPNTIRWSQAFGLNDVPTDWTPTIVNIANEVDAPLRGPAVDGFPLNGNFYIMSYWDTIMLAPIAYTTTSAPVFGVSLVTKGRGLLNDNCFAIADEIGYGIDARDIWMLNQGVFTDLGNQRVKNYFYNNLNPTYVDQVFMVNNTSKNQIEIYYPDLNSTSHCNKMISYRYDLQVWNPPRDVLNVAMGVESPRYTGSAFNLGSRGVAYVQSNVSNGRVVMKDVGNAFLNNTAINALFQRDNINFGTDYSAKIQVHRVYPEVYGTGNVTVQVGGSNSVGQSPTFKANVVMTPSTNTPWVQIAQNTNRTASIKISSNDATDTWQVTQANWQLTITEDTR